MVIHGKRTRSNPEFKKVYETWYNMMQRCYNKKNPYYRNYGGGGITVCEKWRTFDGFLEDFDKIKGFTSDIFTTCRKFYLDKDSRNLSCHEYNLENCEFVSIEESNRRKQHQMKKFRVVGKGIDSIYTNQSQCARDLGLTQSIVSHALRRNVESHGYFFTYL